MEKFIKNIKKTGSVFLSVLMLISIFTITFPNANATSKTQQEAIQWVKSQVGKSIDMDGAPADQPYQCVDLIKAYYSYLGVTPVPGNGTDYTWNDLPDGWSRIQGADPQPGDILVYSGSSGNQYGHVAIFESTWSTYHQNFDDNSCVVQVTYVAYNGLTNPYWGVIRPNWSSTTNVNFTSVWESYITQTNAQVNATIDGTTIDTCGFYIGTSESSMNKTSEDTYAYTKNIWFNLNEYGVSLTAGTTYYYKMFVTVGGKEFCTDIRSFKTSGTNTANTPDTSVTNGVELKLNSLRSKFPNNSYWNHLVTTSDNDGDSLMARWDESFADSVTNTPCVTHNAKASIGQYDCNFFDGGIQCFGFAGKIFYDVFGQRKSSLPINYGNDVQVGDYVRMNNDTHSAVVLSRNGNNITVVECNLDLSGSSYNCIIRWDHTYSIDSITYYVRASNYDEINASSTTTDAKYFTSAWESDITDTNAQVNAAITGTYIDTCGFYLGTSESSMNRTSEDTYAYTKNIWFNMNEYGVSLTAGTTYYYKMFITIGGTEYCTDIRSFTTSGCSQHSYTDEITKEATCTSTGIRTYTCTICGYSYNETIEKSSVHSNLSITQSGKYNSISTFNCSACGESYVFDLGVKNVKITPIADDAFNLDIEFSDNNLDYRDVLVRTAVSDVYTTGYVSHDYTLRNNGFSDNHYSVDISAELFGDHHIFILEFCDKNNPQMYFGQVWCDFYSQQGQYINIKVGESVNLAEILETNNLGTYHLYDYDTDIVDYNDGICTGKNYGSTTIIFFNISGGDIKACTIVVGCEEHTFVTEQAVAATCTKTGLTEGIKCSVCGEVLKAQEVIPTIDHSFGSWTVVTNPTTEKEGIEKRTCSNCGEEEKKSIPKLNYLKGDLNNDGKITAADARLALRISAKLETATDEMTVIADVNDDKKITAVDARMILRVAAKLDSF